MNLSKMFEMQRELDEHIIREKHLEGQDLLPNKILALQVELGELANEWRGFKHWSNDQKPRRHVLDDNLTTCEPDRYHDPLLEEYVDCLHFILSIALETDIKLPESPCGLNYVHVSEQFNAVFNKLGDFWDTRTRMNFIQTWATFYELGKMLGFIEEEIEQAYMSKNAVNHQRQVNGY